MIGVGILISGAAGWWPTLAVVTIGLSIGAEHDMVASIVSRFFGIRAFGALFGLLMSCMGQYRYPAPKKQRAEHLVAAS